MKITNGYCNSCALDDRTFNLVLTSTAYVWARVVCHSSLSFVSTIGILHIHKKMGEG
jgi:hypothetical protein